jgi:hypothetical protein
MGPKKMALSCYKIFTQRFSQCFTVFFKSIRINRIVHEGSPSGTTDQTRLSQYAQMLRDGRLADPELVRQRIDA